MEIKTKSIVCKGEIAPGFDFSSGFYLCLINSDKVPPHLAVIFNNYYYSWTVRKAEIALPVDGMMRLLLSKSKKAVFVKLNIPVDAKVLSDCFASSYKEGLNEQTCLDPIITFFKSSGFQTSGVEVFWDLLEILEKAGVIEGYFNCNHPTNSGILLLPVYDRDQVINHIKALSGNDIT